MGIRITVRSMEIVSAKKALSLSKNLDSIWSKESLLTQRTLIYVAELLEENNRLLCQMVKRKTKLSKWQLHCQKVMREGGTMKDAASTYRKQ